MAGSEEDGLVFVMPYPQYTNIQYNLYSQNPKYGTPVPNKSFRPAQATTMRLPTPMFHA